MKCFGEFFVRFLSRESEATIFPAAIVKPSRGSAFLAVVKITEADLGNRDTRYKP